MKWTTDHHRFVTPNGRLVLVNAVPDAWCITDPSQDALERAVLRLRTMFDRRDATVPWWDAIAHAPRSGQVADVQAWIRTCLDVQLNYYKRSVYVGHLASLRLEGVLLWPPYQAKLPHPAHPTVPAESDLAAAPACTDFERAVLAKIQRRKDIPRSLLLACSPLRDAKGVSDEALLSALGTAVTGHGPWRRHTGDLLVLFRTMEGLTFSAGSAITMTERADRILRARGIKGRRPLRWGVNSDRPDARPWVEAFEAFASEYEARSGATVDQIGRRWLDFLAESGAIPAPAQIERQRHIAGRTGFVAWLVKRHTAASAEPSRIVGSMKRIFGWLARTQGVENPITDSDIPRHPPGMRKSNKRLTPREIIQASREVVRELIDWAYGQVDRDAPCPASRRRRRRADPKAAMLLPPTLRRSQGFEKYLVTVRDANGTARRVLGPALPTLLLLLLTLPLRAVQARLLDSGEADETRPDIRLVPVEHGNGAASVSIAAEWIMNTHVLAERGRRQGVIRAIHDQEAQRDFLGFWVNTNKTQVAGHNKGDDRGYEIPWQHPELLDRLNRLREWQARFNPADRLLARDELAEAVLHPTKALKGRLPSYVYLFRDIRDRDPGLRLHPPTGTDVQFFFLTVLDEVEARLADEVAAHNAAEPDTTKHREPPVLVLKRQGRRPMACAYTLHSLRLTGITAFAEAGVPAPIIAEFLSGHLTVLMTLYYTKFGPATMTRVLAAVEDELVPGFRTGG